MAQTLKFGNGTWATKKGSTLAYNDQNNRYKPLPFTTTRASSATRVNKQGLIEVVENDRPRIDYTDSADGALLLEPQRSNLFPYSEDFTQWFQPNATVTITSNEAPDGTTNSVYNLSGTNANLYYGGTPSVEHTISFYIKSNGQGKDKFKIRLGNNISEEFTATNEWVRYSFTSTPSTTVFGITTSSAPNNEFDLLVWGAQSEQASYATSYIPTQGSAVTRSAETASGAGNSEVFNDSEGVLFADISALANDLTYRGVSIGDGTANNLVRFYYENISNRITAQIKNAGVAQATMTYTFSDITISSKIVVKYKLNDFALWVNGFKVDSLVGSGSTPSSLSSLQFDTGIGGDLFYGKTKEIGYYDATLTDAELETLTSYRSLNELVTELNLNTL